MRDSGYTVIKIGGSILRDEAAYRTIARRLAAQLQRGPTWAVVSAAGGVTDALERLACATDARDPRIVLAQQAEATGVRPEPHLEIELRRGVRELWSGRWDRLLAWGEQASASALRAHLAREGVDVPVVELAPETPTAPGHAALVPGFYLRDGEGGVRCLPRGGSDISAVLVAIRLGARTVRFWKEGGGIRSAQGVVPEVDAATLLDRLANSVRPLHPEAIRLATRWGIDLILEDPFGQHAPTRVVSGPRSDRLQSFGSSRGAGQRVWWSGAFGASGDGGRG